VHVGETSASPASDVLETVEIARPHRIGHGIQAAYSDEALRALRENKRLPGDLSTSNIQTHAWSRSLTCGMFLCRFQTRASLHDQHDNPYLSHTNLRYEIDLLLRENILSREQLLECFRLAEKFSFL